MPGETRRLARVLAHCLLPAAALMIPLSLPPHALGSEEDVPGGEGRDIDRLHERVSGMVLGTAGKIDGFFGESTTGTLPQNRSYIRLRLDMDWGSESGLDLSPNLNVHLVLPGTTDRLRLIINEDEDQGETPASDANEDSSLALRFVGVDTRRSGLSFDVGLRLQDWDLAGFVRLNAMASYPLSGSWRGRTSNQLYWYTDTKWRDDFRQYFELTISDNLFFRARTRIQYFDEEGSELFPEQKFSLFQRLSDRQALAYEALVRKIPADDSLFDDDEILEAGETYVNYQVRLRYRINAFRPWLFFELWPVALFPEERDFEFNYGARLRVEARFGHVTSQPVKLGE